MIGGTGTIYIYLSVRCFVGLRVAQSLALYVVL